LFAHLRTSGINRFVHAPVLVSPFHSCYNQSKILLSTVILASITPVFEAAVIHTDLEPSGVPGAEQ
jgi:hypothetical protein